MLKHRDAFTPQTGITQLQYDIKINNQQLLATPQHTAYVCCRKEEEMNPKIWKNEYSSD